MSVALVEAIDSLLAFIDGNEYSAFVDDVLSQFEDLDLSVYVQARKLNLLAEMPQRDAENFTTSPALSPEFLGKTNLPAFFLIDSQSYQIIVTRPWQEQMRALRAIAADPNAIVVTKLPTGQVETELIEAPSFTKEQQAVLLFLYETHPRQLGLVEIEIGTNISKKTCGKVVNSLIGRGLVHRSNGQNKGASVTAKGEAIACKFKSKDDTVAGR